MTNINICKGVFFRGKLGQSIKGSFIFLQRENASYEVGEGKIHASKGEFAALVNNSDTKMICYKFSFGSVKVWVSS